jgi:hypothetical protein
MHTMAIMLLTGPAISGRFNGWQGNRLAAGDVDPLGDHQKFASVAKQGCAANEHAPAGTLGPPCREIVCNGGSHFGWQGHLCHPLSFAAHRDQTGFPLEVVQREGNHFAGSQAQTCQQEQKGESRLPMAVALSHEAKIFWICSPARDLGTLESDHVAMVGTHVAKSLATIPRRNK